MNEKLKLCPFCGGCVEAVKRIINSETIYFIKCHKCGATVSFDNLVCNNNPIKSIDYWNRRVENAEV